MSLPKIIDNDRSSMLDVLKKLCGEHQKLSIATGYWDLGAVSHLLEEIDGLNHVRLLIGREPLIPRSHLVQPELDFPTFDIKYDLSHVDPSSSMRETASRIIKWIADGKLEVKVFTKTFLHAKAYVFGDLDSNNAVGLIGSSNFTKNGLTENTELNALEPDHRVVVFQPQSNSQETGHLSWFNKMWDDERAIEWTKQFGEILEYSPVGDRFFSPFETYIKTLHVLYKEEIEEKLIGQVEQRAGRTLFDFQIKNTQALQRRLNKYGVAMLSDSVGLGKTSTAINVMRNYLEDASGRKRVEIICPKSIVQQWEKELTSEGIYGQRPITLQNMNEIEQKRELDHIASVSLFVIDESHNLRQTSGVRFQQLLDWVRDNPQAHVLLLTATPINNSLTDLTNQILLGTGGNAELMKITVTGKGGQTTQITFHQAVENLKKKINQDLKRDGRIDYAAIREVMTPIIRTFVVRRTRQGIQQEYGSLVIDGQERSFPKVYPGLIEYIFSKEGVDAIREISSEGINLAHIYRISPDDLIEKCKDLAHPYDQAMELPVSDDSNQQATESPMFYVFQLILLLGFVPYRWMMYQTKYHGKTRVEINEMRLNADERKKLFLQLGIFGIFRTTFLKRMESSVSALRTSLDTYQTKLLAFEKGVKEGRIVSIADLSALEASFGDEDLEVDPELLAETTLDEITDKTYNVQKLLDDIDLEKTIIQLLDQQLEIMAKDDSKIRKFAECIDNLRQNDPERKILVFSYFSDTVKFLQENLFKYSKTSKASESAFLTSQNRADAENFASRFSPKAKKYEFKEGETELNLLVSTDVLSEGQNLQDAGVLINFDLHWNPVRMIQRNGRINRLGSEFEEVSVFNLKPESELDGYLRLIQRLQGKIDIIRNTIGTDSPVLEEPENPLEFTDALSDIYSHEIQERIKALEDAERAADYLLSEDEFVMDLKKFISDSNFSEEYKDSVLNISNGKWGLFPDVASKNPPIMGLSELKSENGTVVGHQFVEIDTSVRTVKAVNTLRALEFLRTSAKDNERTKDVCKIDKVAAKKLIEKSSITYSDEEEVGALIGQENDVLRILFDLNYSEDEINLVRDGFKTPNVLFKREMESAKRNLMNKHRRGENTQAEIKFIIDKAREIKKHQRDEVAASVQASEMILGYIDRKLNG